MEYNYLPQVKMHLESQYKIIQMKNYQQQSKANNILKGRRGQGAIQGQAFRQESMNNFGVIKVDQHSESIHVESEQSIQKQKHQCEFETVPNQMSRIQYKKVVKSNTFKDPVNQFSEDLGFSQSLLKKADESLENNGVQSQRVEEEEVIENETNSGFVILGIFVFAMKLVYKIRHKIVMNRIVKEHFELINDKSSFYDELTQQKNKNSLMQKEANIDEDSIYYLLWIMIMSLVLTFYLLYLPIQTVYQLDQKLLLLIIFLIVAFIYFLDLLINLNTSKLILGTKIKKRVNIFYHYLQNHSHLDLSIFITIVPIFYSQLPFYRITINHIQYYILAIFFLPFILKFNANFNQHLFLFSCKNISILKKLVILLIIINYQVCLFIHLQTDTLNFNYSQNLSHVLVTIFTLDNYYQHDSLHQLIIIPIQFYTLYLFFIILYEFGYYPQTEYDLISKYYANRNIDYQLQLKIRRFYYDQIHLQSITSLEQKINEGNLKLSKEIRESLFKQQYESFKKKSIIFNKILSPQTQTKLSKLFEVVTYNKDDFLIKQQEIPSKLIFLISGEAAIVGRQQNQLSIDKSCILNEYQFFNQSQSCISIQAKTQCKVAQMQYALLQELLQKQKEYEKFCMWQDKLKLNPQIKSKLKKCLACNQDYHIIEQCPYLFLIIDQLKTKLDSTYSAKQSRFRTFRKEIKKQNSVLKQNTIGITAINLAQNLGILEQQIGREMMGKYLGEVYDQEDLFDEQDEQNSRYQKTHTLNYQNSGQLSPRTRTNRTGKQTLNWSEYESNLQNISGNENESVIDRHDVSNQLKQQQQGINDSIIVNSSPGQSNQYTRQGIGQREQIHRKSNQSISLTIERAVEKRLSSQSQNQLQPGVHSTSILQSQQNVLQSHTNNPSFLTNNNLVSSGQRQSTKQIASPSQAQIPIYTYQESNPYVMNEFKRVIQFSGLSILQFNSNPVNFSFFHDKIIEGQNESDSMRYFEDYFPHQNFERILQKFMKYQERKRKKRKRKLN